MIRTKRELAELIAFRDKITRKEALYRVYCTQQIIDDCITNCTYEDLEEILADKLGLEMDYMHIFLFNM